MYLKSLACSALFSSLCASAFAADIQVVPGDSIQAAIISAAPGDRILVEPGTYFERLDYLGKAIEVIGVGGAQHTILDADGLGTAVRFTSGEGLSSVLRGFTVTHGSGGLAPGGVWALGTPTVEDCVIAYNTGRQGAGVRGNAVLVRCTIEHNTSSMNHGGGVLGAPTLIDCVIRSNTCSGARGGGLYLIGGRASLTRCEIVENHAVLSGSRGGGVYVNSTANVLFDHCVIARNQVSGGVFGSFGGGAFVEAATATFQSCTVVDNILSTGNLAGGGIYGPAVVVDSIVRDNQAEQLLDVVAVRYSDVSGGFAGPGNIDQDPLFRDAAGGDYHLLAGSPCIDSGDPTSPLDSDGSRADMGANPFDATWPPPTNYCENTLNSTGVAASISASGTWSLAANDLVFRAEHCPAQVSGLFFQGAAETLLPVWDGFLCVAGPQFRLAVVSTNASGMASYAYDGAHPANGAPAPTVGSTWRYQFWYRDPFAGGTGANFTNGLAVTFIP